MEKTTTCPNCGNTIVYDNPCSPAEGLMFYCHICDTTWSFEELSADMVSHPPHYQSKKGIEVIDVIEAYTEDLKGIEAADTANVIKYICRWKHKNGLEDLEKAQWYLNHLINHVKGE